jgi:hypothetical protein
MLKHGIGRSCLATILLAFVVLILLTRIAGSEGEPPQPTIKAAIAIPDPYQLDMLIRSTLIALHHANQSGNYAVFRDLAAPEFQSTNTAADLGAIFANLRNQKLDLMPIIFFTPKPFQHPHLDENGMLRLVGYFPTQPLQLNFDLAYQQVFGDWRVFGISVEAVQAVAQAPPALTINRTVANKTDLQP